MKAARASVQIGLASCQVADLLVPVELMAEANNLFSMASRLSSVRLSSVFSVAGSLSSK